VNNRPGLLLARVAGFPVYLSPSWFVIAALVVVLFAPQVAASSSVQPPQTYVVAGGYAVLLLASVLVHELAHAFTARAVGLPVEQVVADLWGGHTQFTQEAPDPGRSALVAVVGPVSNAELAGGGYLVLGLVHGDVSGLLLEAGIYTNLFVAAFNLAPGLPLDGGRLVESAVWALTRRRWTGTIVAGWCGRVVAVAVVVWLVLLPLADNRRPTAFGVVWAVLIAGLLWRGASGAIELGQVLRAAERLDLGAYLEPARALPVTSADWRPDRAPGHVVALDERGHPVGILRVQDAARHVGAEQPPGPRTPLSAVMTVLPSVVVVPADLSGEGVLRTLSTQGAHLLVAVDPVGRVVGVADAQRLAHALTGRP
jgi:Zn-dependent protease